MRRVLLIVGFLLIPTAAHSQVVITELLWMGSDQSSADEWIELLNTSEETVDLSGWSIRYMQSNGEERTMLTLEEGADLGPGSYFLISNYSADASRLSIEPDVVTTAVSLPNSHLLLKLLNDEDVIVDQVDDGTGAPFAGRNSSTEPKASMERVDPLQPGTIESNWQTAWESIHFDDGPEIFGTPAAPNSSGGTCSDDLVIGIQVQSGKLYGVGSTTVNFKAVALQGSLHNLACTFDFGDGVLSSSCNPGPHTFEYPDVFTVTLSVINRCGEELTESLTVTVDPDPSTHTSYDGASIILTSLLPNPEGADAGFEHLEFLNLTNRITSLDGWKLVVETSRRKTYRLSGDLSPHGVLNLYSSEESFSLPNTTATVELLDPLGGVRSTFEWEKAEQGRRYYPLEIGQQDVSGRVLAVLGPTQFVLELGPRIRETVGSESALVELIGATDIRGVDQEGIVLMMGSDWLRALVQAKNVILEFEDELWTADGALRAHAFLHSSLNVAEDGLRSGYIQADATKHSKAERYTTLTENAKDEERGLWSFVGISSSSSSVSSESTVKDLTDIDGLMISEIYSSPFPESQRTEDSNPLLFQEWIELFNASDASLDLSGHSLTVGTKEIFFPDGMVIDPQSYAVLTDEEVSLRLKNSGDKITLVVPIEYPTLKHGSSYAFFEDAFCVTVTSTPGGKNICEEPVPVDRSAAAKKAVATRKAKTIAGYVGIYEAQAAKVSGDPIILGASDRSDVPIVFLLLSLGFGLLSGIGGAWWMIRTEVSKLSR